MGKHLIISFRIEKTPEPKYRPMTTDEMLYHALMGDEAPRPDRNGTPPKLQVLVKSKSSGEPPASKRASTPKEKLNNE